MSLTKDDLQILKRKFAPGEHEFKNSYVYITELAVSDRIEEVDPAWTFEILHTNIRDNQAVVHARLTIKGVSRDGVGMQDIKEKAGEPEKGAATDALKRCARLFGIGRYLLDTPSFVTNAQTLSQWLNGSNPQNSATSSGFAQNMGTGDQNGANVASNGEWHCNSVTVKQDRNNKAYLLYNCLEGKASGRGREDLRKAGYQCEDWTVTDQTYELNPLALITVKRNGEYWNVLSVATTEVMF